MPIRSHAFLLMVCAMVCVLLAPVRAQDGNGWCRHKQMYAVPVPGRMVIDGHLDDWDLSGAIEVYVMPETRERQSGRFAVMVDAQALYLGASVRDPTPLMNSNAPETDGDKGWDGDAVQFRLSLDPTQAYPLTDATWHKTHNDTLAHLTLWYFTARREANLVVQKGMDYQAMPGAEKYGVIPKGLFQAAYRPADDQRGYTFEYRIPWSTLGARGPLTGGNTVAAAMQLLWGRNGNEHIGINGVTYDLQVPGGFAYQNAAVWGKLIIAKAGKIPKALAEDGLPAEKPLPLTFAYDLPESSQVTIQLFNDKQEVVRVLAGEAERVAGHNVDRWDGLDALGHPLPAGRYTWRGLYHQPITTRHVLSVNNSGQPPWKTDGNTGGWGGDHGAPCASCAVGEHLILAWNSAEAGWGIIRVTAEGKKLWGILRAATCLAGAGERIYLTGDDLDGTGDSTGIEVVDKQDFHPLLFGNGQKTLAAPPGGEAKDNLVSGLAVSGGRLFASYKRRNLIAGYDAMTGNLLTTIPVPAPGALAARRDGTLAVLSAGQLVLVRDGIVTPLTAEHLDQPQGVAVDAAGNLYVSNQGHLQNVSVFSADGRYLRSIGKAGGRPWMGNFDPAGMLCPTSVTIDAKGRLWVTETIDAPKRVSVWNVQDGRLDKEFFGGAHYSAHIWMDRERPDEIYCDNVLWSVDLQRKSWTPKSTIWRPAHPNSPGLYGTHGNGFKMFTAKNGRQYGWGTDVHLGTVLAIREGNTMKPLLAFFWTYAQKPFIGYPITADAKQYPDGGTYIWVDRNDDQLLQADEITAANLSPDGAKRYFRGFACVDADLNLWHARGAVNRPVRILENGRPVYDFSRPEITPVGPGSVDAAGALYTLSQDDTAPEKIGYGKWLPTGELQWGLTGYANWPKAISYPAQQPGKLWGPTALLGEAGQFTGFNTYFGVAHLYTTDGLFVSKIFKDMRVVTDNFDANVISCENYNGCLVQPKGTGHYYFLGGDQDGRVTEVLGLETVKRLPGGEYHITEADTTTVAAAWAAYHAGVAGAQSLTIARGKLALDTATGVSKTLDSRRAFTATAAYDAANLYVKYTVTCPAKLHNSIPEPSLVFKGGNLLDIQLAADPRADPQRKTPAPGDLRLLITRRHGQPYVVIFRPKVAGFTGKPVILTSPVAKEAFDAIEVSERIGLEYTEVVGRPAFTALVTIPLAMLGWQPQPGTTVKMDLGYIYGDVAGNQATARSYWKNNGFSANVLKDVPSESRLEPGEWGEARVE
jgi:hypothetical protein